MALAPWGFSSWFSAVPSVLAIRVSHRPREDLGEITEEMNMTVFEVDKHLFSFLAAASGVLGVPVISALLFCSSKRLRLIRTVACERHYESIPPPDSVFNTK